MASWLNGHEFQQAQVNSERQGSLAYCSPWGHKESDMTEWLNYNKCISGLPQRLRWYRICPQCRMKKSKWKLLSSVWLFDIMDYNLPGSSVHGILQARILEWVDYPFSSLFSWPRNWTGVSCIAGGFFISWVSMEAIQDTGFNPRSGRSPGGGHGNPLQYSGLEDSMESGASWATVHSVAKSHKQLRQLGTHAHISTNA